VARLILDIEGGKREIPVTGSTVIGRSPQVAVPLDDAKLSREHCSVFFDGSKFVVEDLASRNGTFLNGHKVASVAPLYGGDEIKIGNTAIRFVLDPTDPGVGVPRPGAYVPANPTGGGGHPLPSTHATRRAKAAEAAGPGAAARAFGWIVLAALLAGSTYGMKFAFVWALRELRP